MINDDGTMNVRISGKIERRKIASVDRVCIFVGEVEAVEMFQMNPVLKDGEMDIREVGDSLPRIVRTYP